MPTQIGSQHRVTLEDEGLTLVDRPYSGTVILRNPVTEDFELYIEADDHAGFTVEIDGIGYEYCRSAECPDDLA